MRRSRVPNTNAARRPLVLGCILLLAALSVACGSKKSETRAVPAAVASPVRGTEEAADSVPEQVRTAVYRSLVRTFFRPVSGQARWIDPHPLGEKRGSADSAIHAVSDDELPPDAGWAAGIAEAAALERVCVLGGAEDGCRGRKGGVLRFPPVYAAGPGRVHVYVRYTPHGGAEGPVTEQRFTLAQRTDYWRIVEHVDVTTP
jgi:hypothetical protein